MTQPPESPRDPSEGAAPDEPRAPWAAPEQPPAAPGRRHQRSRRPNRSKRPRTGAASAREPRGRAPAGDWTQTASPQWPPPPGQPTPRSGHAAGPTGRTRAVAIARPKNRPRVRGSSRPDSGHRNRADGQSSRHQRRARGRKRHRDKATGTSHHRRDSRDGNSSARRCNRPRHGDAGARHSWPPSPRWH